MIVCAKCGAPAEAGQLGTGSVYVPMCWTHADDFMEALSRIVPGVEGREGLRHWYADTTAPDGSRQLSPHVRPA